MSDDFDNYSPPLVPAVTFHLHASCAAAIKAAYDHQAVAYAQGVADERARIVGIVAETRRDPPYGRMAVDVACDEILRRIRDKERPT